MRIVPVILCGGPGMRLWPASTQARPKPLLDLLGGPSLLQRTLLRVARIEDAAPPLVVAGLAHAEEVRRQMLAIGAAGKVFAEPAGRDSAAALLAAVFWLARREPEALVMAVASDHHIPDVEAFATAVREAAPAAAQGAIVTFGLAPDRPATAFGYIRPGDRLNAQTPVRRVLKFEEKPDAKRAEALIADGCLWNSGNFLFRAREMIEEAQTHCPAVSGPVMASLPYDGTDGTVIPLGPAFCEAARTSIDVAVMEKTSRAAVLPIAYAWSDLGAWDAVWRVGARNGDGNLVNGAARLIDVRDSLVRADGGARVVVVGLENIAVIAAGADVLVADLARSAEVKEALERPLPSQPGPFTRPDLALESERLRTWLMRSALPAWWCFGADHVHGGFHEALGRDFAAARLTRRARVQARQSFVYATAGALGWPGPWRAAMDHGLDFLEARLRRADGLYAASLAPDGSVDETALLYDQAFVLLAWAAACRGEPELISRARALAVRVREAFAHGDGFRAHERESIFLADPLMHLFEASLAWMVADPVGPWGELADDLAALFLQRLFDEPGGRVFEVYDADFRPLELEGEDRLEPGHHFEWAWLLGRWSRAKGRPEGAAAARSLYATGRAGIDARTGLVVDALRDDLSFARATSRLWPQTEWIKAALALHDHPTHSSEAVAAIRALGVYFEGVPAGLWRDAPPASALAATEQVSLASSFYHIVGAIAELPLSGN